MSNMKVKIESRYLLSQKILKLNLKLALPVQIFPKARIQRSRRGPQAFAYKGKRNIKEKTVGCLLKESMSRLYPLDRIRNISAGRFGTILRIRAKSAPLIYFFTKVIN